MASKPRSSGRSVVEVERLVSSWSGRLEGVVALVIALGLNEVPVALA